MIATKSIAPCVSYLFHLCDTPKETKIKKLPATND